MERAGEPRCRLAIDGPSASGKSAVGSAVAARLGYPFLDTGVMYRAFTWYALQRGVAPTDVAALAQLAHDVTMNIDVRYGEGRQGVHIDGLDATPHLREPAVEQAVSHVSAVPAVRARLVALQRQLGSPRVVMAGRDIGSVVLPDAEVKVYLDASAEERARRRELQLRAHGEAADYDRLLAEMRRRDQLDSSRTVAPLRPADDAVTLMTDGLSLDAVIEQVLHLVERQGARRGEAR